MKVLWLVNIVMPQLAAHLGHKATVFGGWLSGAMEAVRASNHELVICTTDPKVECNQSYSVAGITYYLTPLRSVQEMQNSFQGILEKEKPDVVHIYGTEFPHSVSMFHAAGPDRTVVTIQGSMIYYKDNVYAGLQERLCRDTRLHKLLRTLHCGGDSIELQKKRYEERAVYETEVLRHATYINGGSEWGNAVGRSVNPDCITFDCKLILRDSFYDGPRWSLDRCEPHSIYVLHSYPIKGFHKFLEALPIVVRKYPDTKVYVVSSKLRYRNYSGLKAKVMDAAPDYDWLIQKQIESHHLQKHLVSLGRLEEAEVKETMLKCHVYVSPSSIENQSTTLGEAMILGVPSVASCVGAIQEMISDGTDGFLYPFHEPYILANQILRIFDNPELAQQFSERGHAHAASTYNRERNGENLIHMYEAINARAKEK